jgi:hypothetical protein
MSTQAIIRFILFYFVYYFFFFAVFNCKKFFFPFFPPPTSLYKHRQSSATQWPIKTDLMGELGLNNLTEGLIDVKPAQKKRPATGNSREIH